MPEISNKKKKFIKRNFKLLSVEELAHHTGLKQTTVRSIINQYTAQLSGEDKNLLRDSIPNNSSLIRRAKYTIVVWSISIFLLTFSVYIPALNNDFVWDDKEYISESTLIRSLDVDSLYRMFTSFSVGNWHPLTSLSHAIDYALWKLNPFGYHLTNIIIHGLNTLLVFLLVIQLVLREKKVYAIQPTSKTSLSFSTQSIAVAGITALLFGIHPLHVESVAWVSERKDLLCAFFIFLSLLYYLSYISSVLQKKRWFYFNTCLLFFVFALMSKPMAVTLPLILLLFDFYPLKRIRFYSGKTSKQLPILSEKIPFFVLTVALSVVTIIAQQAGGAIENFERLPISFRLLNAINTLMLYLKKMVWPLELVPFYPYPNDISILDAQYLISGISLIAITGGCLLIVKFGKYLFFTAWSYYIITLLPVLGIIQVGGQAAADRYTYLPSISIFLLLSVSFVWCWVKSSMTNFKMELRVLLLICICIVVSLLSYLTIRQNKIWENSETLWSYVVATLPIAPSEAHIHLGAVYYKRGRLDDAIAEYKKALEINPEHAGIYTNLGNIYDKKGEVEEAITAYQKAISIDPLHAKAYYNLGIVYNKKSRLDEAISEYKKAITINPHYANAHTNLGSIYEKKGRVDEAIAEYKKAITINPYHVIAHYNLGTAYNKKNRLDEAISEYKKAITINPHYANAHYYLSITYYKKENYTLSIVHCDKALELGYNVSSQFLKKLEPYR